MRKSTFEGLRIEKLIERVKKYSPGDGYKLVEKAYAFAAKAHEGVKRLSGEPYIEHPLFVASVLTELMLDPPTIAAGLLHDTLEDVESVTYDLLVREFGEEVAQLVDGVTKLKRLNFSTREEAQAESMRKMVLAMSRDIRVVLIKLADRLHNMRTLDKQKPERQVPIAQETMDIYAPLAHRLGVYAIKQELEDLALLYIDPAGYQEVKNLVETSLQPREASIAMIIGELSAQLDAHGLHYDIDGRQKHIYSIYRKMVLQSKRFDEIYDLIAIRVLVDTVADCYMVLYIVHNLWNQMPGRFKDYISVPKANMYQSLHTTVMGGRRFPFPFEVQIRTWEMHRVAEYGIAAHWRYKDGGRINDLDNKLSWLRRILDWQNETRDSKEFIDTLKTDLFSEEVLLFTPKGDVITMAKGATPIDFAYAIHSEVGNKCVGAKVNGKLVPLDSELQTGDRVEIQTSAACKGPSIDWIRICKTAQARAKIRQFLRKAMQTENTEIGRTMVEHECKRRGTALNELLQPEYYDSMLRKYGLRQVEDIFAAVGYGGMSSAYVVQRLLDEQRAHLPQQQQPKPEGIPTTRQIIGRATNGVILEGNEDMDIQVRFAACCNPVPGDDIVGYITRGRGVTVHKAECANAQHFEPERRVNVAWADASFGTFCASIKIRAYDRIGLLGEISTFISSMGVPIRNVACSVDRNRIATIKLVMEVRSRDQMDTVIRQLQKQQDVIEVNRVNG